jgi:hypothetical protein
MPPSHDAFISYSHAVDRPLADAFERGLEQLAKPLLKLRALDVFRDETSLSASPGVWPAIEAHLAGSRWLVCFACPEAAASIWCEREIRWWLDHRSREHLLIVLTGGALVWDPSQGDLDWQRTTALPPTMAGRLGDEPLYIDLTWARGSDGLSLKNLRFRDAVVGAAAPIRGIDRDALDGADVRQHARNRRFVQIGVTAIAAAGGFAVWQAIEARAERNIAERERAEAVAQRAAADEQRGRAEKALAATQRELLRAQSAELRGLLQRVDRLLAAALPGPPRERLQQERQALLARLETTTREHQQRLSAEIGFRGDFLFLQRWEGNVGGVRADASGAMIDPQTWLLHASPQVIRQRYEFVLTPDELDGVLALVGLRDEAVQAAWRAHPALCRIRLEPNDVARLVPEVAGEFWLRLVKQYPAVLAPSVTPAMHTAFLSLAFSAGNNRRHFDPIMATLPKADPQLTADTLERATEATERRLGGLGEHIRRRRVAEANLVRAEAGLPIAHPIVVPELRALRQRGPGC